MMASVLDGMSVAEIVTAPIQSIFVVKPEPQEFLLPPPSLPPPQPLPPVSCSSFNCLVSEKWITTIKTEPVESEPFELEPSATLAFGDLSKSMITDSPPQCLARKRNKLDKNSFKRIIENPRGEARLRRKMQQVEPLAPDFHMLTRHERLAQKRRQQYYASQTKPSTSNSTDCNNRSNTKHQIGKQTTDDTRTWSSCTEIERFEKLIVQPEAEDNTQNIIDDSSLIILADHSILINQPKIVLTRCDTSNLMPELELNHRVELRPKQSLEPLITQRSSKSKSRRRLRLAQIRTRPLKTQKKTRKLQVQKMPAFRIDPRSCRPRYRAKKAENANFKKIVDNPVLEAEADQILSRCTVRDLNARERRKLKIPPLRSYKKTPPSLSSIVLPTTNDSTYSHSSDSSSYSSAKKESWKSQPSKMHSTIVPPTSVSQPSLGNPCAKPIPLDNFRKNPSSSLPSDNILSSSRHQCSTTFEIAGNARRQPIRIKAGSLDSVKIQPAAIIEQYPHLETVSLCKNSDSVQTQILSSAPGRDYPNHKTDSICESSMSLQTQMSSSTCAEHSSDHNAPSMCELSELKKNQYHKTRDSDIFSFCNRIIESASTEARFEDIVNKMSSRFSYDASPNL